MTFKDFFRSQLFRGILVGLLLALAALIIFQAGVLAGQRRSNFAHRMGDSFDRNFRGPRDEGGLPLRDLLGEDVPGGHGAAGKVVSVSLPTFVVSGPDNIEKTVLVSDETLVREYRTELSQDDIAVGAFVVVLGSPNEAGQVEAKLIRMVPPPPEFGAAKE